MSALSNLFFLVLSPPDLIIQDVFSFKRQVWNCVGHPYDSVHSTAHLSLLRYEDHHNESLLYTVSDRISSVKPFNIRIKNFGFFKNNGTIFLEPANKLEIRDLAERLIPGSIFPHITIARNLNPKDFDLVWKNFRNVRYENSFTCNCITVLKRSAHRWVPHIMLPFDFKIKRY